MTGKFKIGDRVRMTKAAQKVWGIRHASGIVRQIGIDAPQIIYVQYEGLKTCDIWNEDYWELEQDAKDTAKK